MTAGGQTPEELETLLEDALLMHDAAALAQLFEDAGVLVTSRGHSSRAQHAETRHQPEPPSGHAAADGRFDEVITAHQDAAGTSRGTDGYGEGIPLNKPQNGSVASGYMKRTPR